MKRTHTTRQTLRQSVLGKCLLMQVNWSRKGVDKFGAYAVDG